MDQITSLVPISVIVAVLIFISKETLELVRRHRADSRKRNAIRKLIAAECEKNNWAIATLNRILSTIKNETDEYEIQYTLSTNTIGDKFFRASNNSGTDWSSTPIPIIHGTMANRFILDAATVDRKIFIPLLNAIDAIAELEYVRNSLVRELNPEEEKFAAIESFAHWGLEKLTYVYEAINYLYQKCTGKDLNAHKIR